MNDVIALSKKERGDENTLGRDMEEYLDAVQAVRDAAPVGEKDRERRGDALIKLSLALDMLKTCVAVPFTADERDKCAFYIREGYDALRQADAPVGWVSKDAVLEKLRWIRSQEVMSKHVSTAHCDAARNGIGKCIDAVINLPATPRPAGSAE